MQVVQLLLYKGARAGAKDGKGRTPLQVRDAPVQTPAQAVRLLSICAHRCAPQVARKLNRGQGDERLVAMLEFANQGQMPDVTLNW